MKKLSALFICICTVIISVFNVFAAMPGDTDKDRIITASDARTVLRASVGLETLTEEEFTIADVDKDGIITAADARTILRASVGLEILHIHNYTDWIVTQEPTCTAAGEKQGVCDCEGVKAIAIPALQHSFSDGICTVCGEVFTEDSVTIPRLDFTGDISNMTNKKDVREIEVSYTSESISFAGTAKIKVQGTSSLAYNKKNYTINLYEDNEYNDKMKVDVGWGKQSKYCLKANWIDKTHSRNIVTAGFAAEIQQKYGLFENTPHNGTIDGFPVEIYINNEFLGIYTFNIPKDAWLFNMDEDNPNHIVFCNEGYQPSNLFYAPADYTTWSLEVGEETDEKLAKLNTLISFIMNSTDEEFRNNFTDHLNLDATLNYYIITEVAHLRDNHAKNLLLVTYDGEIWYPSLYDLDTSWGTLDTGKGLFDYKNQTVSYHANRLWSRFRVLFADEIQQRYLELREEFISKEAIMDRFTSFKALIPENSFTAEAEKWGEIPGYDLSQIEEYLDYMIPALDEKYGYTPEENNPEIPEETTTEAPEETTTEAPEETTTEVTEEATTAAFVI